MYFRLSLFSFVVCTAILTLPGCGSNSQANAKPKGTGYIRFVNMAGEEIVTSDGRGNARPQLAHGEISLKRRAPEGPMTLKILQNKNELYNETIQIKPEVVHTLYTFLGPKGMEHKVFENDPQRGGRGEVVVRLLNLVDGQTASASSFGGLETPIGEEVKGVGAGSDAKLSPGKQSLQVKLGGKKIRVPDFTCASGEAYTLVVYRKKDGTFDASLVRNSASMQIGMGAPTAG